MHHKRLFSVVWMILWLTWLGFVLIILSYPLDKFDGYPHWANIHWLPFGHLSRTDLFETSANVLIFIPFGYLTVRAWSSSRGEHPVFMASLISFFLSCLLEFYQLFCHDRVPATTDLITNVAGGAVGGYLAALISSSQRRRSVDEVEPGLDARYEDVTIQPGG